MDSTSLAGTWRMVIAMVLSGTIGLIVVESGQPLLHIVFYRCLIGGAAMVAWLTSTRGWKPMRRGDVTWLLACSVALMVNWLSLFSAYRYSSISVATVVYHTQPFMLLALAVALQGERLQRERLPWVALAFAGVVLIAELHRAGPGGATWQGVALALLAAFLYAAVVLMTRRLKHLPPAQIATVQMTLGVLVLLPFVAPEFGPMPARGLAAVLTLGLVHTAFMYTIMYAAFQSLPAQSLATLAYVYPVVALLVDLFFYDARPSVAQWVGMAAIVLAVVADQRKWMLGLPWRRSA